MYEINERPRKQHSWARTIKGTKTQEILETTVITKKVTWKEYILDGRKSRDSDEGILRMNAFSRLKYLSEV